MGNPFPEFIQTPCSGTSSVHLGDHGLSPPYSNHSPPHSVQSNLALSPQGYIGKCERSLEPKIPSYNPPYFQVLHHLPNLAQVYQRRLLTCKQCDRQVNKISCPTSMDNKTV